ncbi:unnamed protein product [Kluyveromyces dobzhanskii CBS 2104]|uniref:WGS project CCBQ000000000 data, contig 00028 n=1 Tax=Kluyveromyces dobzhanskii CBS 2104 TaxID=1427455 RepID=A0A0A8L0N9_9SACH|nr:unnamed protein product [Kluyveromyces dobzhanskii CBS 2104]
MVKNFYHKPDVKLEQRVVTNREVISNLLKNQSNIFFISLPENESASQCAELLNNIITRNFVYDPQWNAVLKEFDLESFNDCIFCLILSKIPDWNSIADWRRQVFQAAEMFPTCIPLNDPLKYNFVSDLNACSYFPTDYNSRDIAFASGCSTPILIDINEHENYLSCVQSIGLPNLFTTIDEDCNPVIAYSTGNRDVIVVADIETASQLKSNKGSLTGSTNVPIIIRTDYDTKDKAKAFIDSETHGLSIVGFEVHLALTKFPLIVPQTSDSNPPKTGTTSEQSFLEYVIKRKKSENWLSSLFGINRSISVQKPENDENISELRQFLRLVGELNRSFHKIPFR